MNGLAPIIIVSVLAGALLAFVGQALAPQPVAVSCQPPAPYEQLHIVVVPRAGKFVADCMYVTSRGAAAAAARDGKR